MVSDGRRRCDAHPARPLMRRPAACQGDLLLTLRLAIANSVATMMRKSREAGSRAARGGRPRGRDGTGAPTPNAVNAESELSDRLRERIRGRFGRAADVARLSPLAGDASTRRYLRAALSGPGAPAT